MEGLKGMPIRRDTISASSGWLDPANSLMPTELCMFNQGSGVELSFGRGVAVAATQGGEIIKLENLYRRLTNVLFELSRPFCKRQTDPSRLLVI